MKPRLRVRKIIGPTEFLAAFQGEAGASAAFHRMLARSVSRVWFVWRGAGQQCMLPARINEKSSVCINM